MSHLNRLGGKMSVPIRADAEGYIGRECPRCEEYFKIAPGTGLKGSDVPCHCPYCGHIKGQDHFWTKQQLKYAHSIAFRKITEAFQKDLKEMEFNVRPRGSFGISLSMKFTPRSLPAIRHYFEKQLETEIVCDGCTLRYAIYGVFAFCPDCGTHNSLQILDKNLELARKQVSLASHVEEEMAEQLVADALENAVSSFDGFGREACRVHAAKSSDAAKAEKISFQSLAGAEKNVQTMFGFSLAAGLDSPDWVYVSNSFQKRHVLAHRMGVVDQAYIQATSDRQAVIGRKVIVRAEDVLALLDHLAKLARHLMTQLQSLK